MSRSKTYFRITPILVVLAVLLLTLPVLAQQKKALLLFKSSEESSAAVSRLAINVEPILKNLGFTTTFHDVDQGLPGSVDADVIATWYNSAQIADPEAYVDWMKAQISSGKKVLILGNFGAHTTDGKTWMTNESLNRFFYPFGLKYGAAYTGDPAVLSITKQELPAKQPVPVNYYLLFESVNPANTVYLEVQRSDLANSKSALVVRTPYGGMAQELYVNNLDLGAFVKEVVSTKKQMASTDRRLLGLYKSSENVNEHTNFLARFVAPILYDLGYELDYYDIDQGLPADSRMSNYAGVISWFTTPEVAKAADYINWLAAQNDAGRRVVILGNFGAFAEDVPSKAGDVRRFLQSPEYNRFFYPFGLEFRAAWTPEKKSVQVVKKDESVVTWLEPGHVGHYYWIRSVHPDNKQYLTVNRTDLQDGESAVVVATPHGGLALESYVLGTDPQTKQPRMHIDLKKFLSASLTLQPTSKVSLTPDVAELKSKPDLPPLAKPQIGGNGIYPPDVTPESRKILGFYQSTHNQDGSTNPTALAAQLILEHLGFVMVYIDLDTEPLPTMEEMKSFRGIVLWLTDPQVPNAREFDAWLIQNLEQGRKLALMMDYEIREADTFSLVNPQKLYGAMGLHYDSLGNAPLVARGRGQGTVRRTIAQNRKVLSKKDEWLGFERAINWDDKDLKTSWDLVRSVIAENRVGLTVGTAQGASDVLVQTPRGAVCLGHFAQYDKGEAPVKLNESAQREGAKKAQAEIPAVNEWRIDPYLFFADAFDIQGLGRPDFTTLNGSRIYYSHIDGDAFGGISLIDRSSLNGEMMMQRVLKDLGLPISISYVTLDVEKRLDDKYSRELAVAQKILELPNVEPACHTFSHPFNWVKGDLGLDDSKPGEYVLIRKDIDLEKEVVHAVDFVDKLSPPNKRCRILLWSGKCNPPARAIELVRELGIINMNGGESFIDEAEPLLGGVAPLIGEVHGEIQFHVSAAGDFHYTNSWTGPYDGMKNLPAYLERTDKPRRLRCMNVYYHFYLAEREPGIEGLDAAYGYVKSKKSAPMFASDYAYLLRDWTETKIGKDSQGRFYVANSGLCNTVRFDNDNRYPDLKNSRGVVGFNRHNGALYIHTDGSGEARIAFTETPPTQPFIEQYSHSIKNWKASPDAVSFNTEGQGPVHLKMGGLIPASQYRIEAGSLEGTVSSNSQGVLEWNSRYDGYRTSRQVRIRKVK